MKAVLVNPERCIACHQCELACALEHSSSRDLFAAAGERPAPRRRIYVEAGPGHFSFPIKCRHCDPAPCVQVCPTTALYVDEDKGFVLVERDRCIGCRLCVFACPFGIISFGESWEYGVGKNVQLKCDQCVDRQRRGLGPACVEACKTGALQYGDVNQMLRESGRQTAFRVTSALSGASWPGAVSNLDEFRSLGSGGGKQSALGA